MWDITGTAHQWRTDYIVDRKFHDRKQFVQINDSKSDALIRQIFGLLQGSILGPLFFVIYINDLLACSNELEFIILLIC